METKYCEKCDITKNISDFGTRKRKNGKIYIFKYCKNCEQIRKKQPKYKKTISYNIKEKYNKDEEYKNMMIEKASNYYKQNTEKVKKYQTKYHKKPEVINRRHQRRYDRRQTDEEYRLYCSLSTRIHKLLKSNKIMRTNKYIGCTPKFFKQWLEYNFTPNMSWNNYGLYWNIDHVIPCSSFDFTNLDEQKLCFNWSNCRPLCKIENSSKNNKIIPFQILLQEIRVNYYRKSFCNIS